MKHHASNPRMQRTRSALLRSPVSRKASGGFIRRVVLR